MTLQLALKVSVSNIAVYHSSMSISLGLIWQESQPQTTSPGTKVDLFLLRQVSLYVKNEILS